MTIAECAGLIRDAEELVVVCGAGLSCDVAPLAQAIEDGLWAAAIRLAGRAGHPDPFRTVATAQEIREPYLTLELLVSGLRHRVPALARPLRDLYDRLFRMDPAAPAAPPRPGRANEALAKALRTAGAARAVVLTSNFDNGLMEALRRHGPPFRLVTDANVGEILAAPPDPGLRVDVCAYHGTVDPTHPPATPPTSMAARDLAHPFTPDLSRYVGEALSSAVGTTSGLVLFVGHRGEDYYDLNIEIARAVAAAEMATAEMADDAGWRRRFACIPHMGRSDSVSEFYRETFTDEVFITLTDGAESWLVDLCDAVSGEATPPPGSAAPARKTAQDVARDFVDLVAAAPGLDQDVVARQCAALLADIEAGILAAWSVTEHYRLESLGYTQTEIAAFGRPGLARHFHGVRVADLITLQADYQNKFRKPFDARFKRGTGEAMLPDGLALMRCFEAFSERALRAMAPPPSGTAAALPGTQRAMAALLASIGYDYAGLIAMRCGKMARPLPVVTTGSDPVADPVRGATLADLRKAVARLDLSDFAASQLHRADDLFSASVALAEWAGIELGVAAAAEAGPGDADGYRDSLAQIVPWEDWALAPEENRLRLPPAQDLDQAGTVLVRRRRVEGYQKTIDRRIRRIEKAIANPADKSFSAVGDAAQCAQRLAEAMRWIMDVGETGRPDPGNRLDGADIDAAVAEIEERALYCLEVGRTNSSRKNVRFLSAYDALVLAALYRDETTGPAERVADAMGYALSEIDGKEWSDRAAKVESRLKP